MRQMRFAPVTLLRQNISFTISIEVAAAHRSIVKIQNADNLRIGVGQAVHCPQPNMSGLTVY